MTYEQVEEAVAALQAEGLRISAAAIIQKIGGSKRDVVRHLRELRGTGNRSQDPIEPALVSEVTLESALAGDPEPMLVSPRCGSVVRYRVTAARFFRTTPLVGLVRIPQGTVLDDVTPDELRAFPHVFQRLEELAP